MSMVFWNETSGMKRVKGGIFIFQEYSYFSEMLPQVVILMPTTTRTVKIDIPEKKNAKTSD